MIRDTITTINERIAQQLDTNTIQVAGMAVVFQDQQENAVSLRLVDEPKRLVMDSGLLWQSAHLTDGSSKVRSQNWGSFTDNIYNVRFVLIGLSKSAAGFDVAMRALDGVGYVVIDNFQTDTLPVLTRYWRVKVGQDKNYDPDLFAFAISYHIEGVCDEDFAELPTDQDLSELPVIVPEPVPGPPGPVGPPGPTGEGVKTSYTHTQNLPSSIWLVNHNLGFIPAGITVYDSAGEQWWPASINHQDTSTLVLDFNNASFSGKAYLS